MKTQNLLLIIAVIIVAMMAFKKMKCTWNDRENMTGFGVTSGLAFNNRTAYCQPGNGDSFSGGCFLPHRVIV